METSCSQFGNIRSVVVKGMLEEAASLQMEPPDFKEAPLPALLQDTKYRFYRITAISESSCAAHRLSMTNVFSCLNSSGCSLIYVLTGGPEGIRLYLGVASGDMHERVDEECVTLKQAFEGNFLGAKLEAVDDDAELGALLQGNDHTGLITGVPSYNEEKNHADGEDFQGMERLVNSLLGEQDDHWKLIIVARSANENAIRARLDRIYDLCTKLSIFIKASFQHGENEGDQTTTTKGSQEGRSESTNEGKSEARCTNQGGSISREDHKKEEQQTKSEGNSTTSTTSGGSNSSTNHGTNTSCAKGETSGKSFSLTKERIDKRYEELQKHLSETLIERFSSGLSKGMYRTAIYVCAPTRSLFNRLSRSVLSIFQGNRSSFSPLRVHELEQKANILPHLFCLRQQQNKYTPETALVHSIAIQKSGGIDAATWLTANELALIAGLPSKEVPGLVIRKSVDFAVNTPAVAETDRLMLGKLIQHGRELTQTVNLSKKDLNKHVFVTGVTGAGKTTTCMKLLLESGLPFLVIEPAKTEYRALHGQRQNNNSTDQFGNIQYYCLAREDLTTFRLNPFELVNQQENLVSHIDILSATLRAVFPMEAAIPQIMEEAIITAYQKRGWDIHGGENFYCSDPWAVDADVWPTFSDMIAELGPIIKSKGMGKEFEEKYQGTIVARLTSLTLGTKGRMLNTRRSLDFDALLDQRVVIELDEIKDDETKALFMGLLITRLAECVKHRHRRDKGFRHITLIEEAHRLLARSEPGQNDSRKLGVEMFANMLSEVRKYGEGLIIADQIPNKLVPDVLKNTHTKIVHCLFARDDRDAVGDAMSLTDEQKNFLPLLKPGETVIYCGGWHAPVRAQIMSNIDTNAPDIKESEIRNRGCQQLWNEREKLLPKLSKNPMLHSPENLSDSLKDATSVIARIVKLLHQLDTGDKRVRLTYQNLCQKLERTELFHVIDNHAHGELLADALSDLASSSKISSEDYVRYREVFPKMLESIRISFEEFLLYYNKVGEFEQLKNLDSF